MSPRRQSELSLEYILLGFLNRQDVHGYDLYKLIQNCTSIAQIWTIKQSQMYALLNKLENLGLLVSTQVPGEAHPWRREYRITDAGRQQFRKWMTSPVAHGRDMRQEFLARLFFALRDQLQTARQLITTQQAACRRWLDELQAERAQQIKKAEDEQAFLEMVFQFRIQQVKAMLDWLNTCEEALE